MGPSLSFTDILCLYDYPHNLTKYEIKGTSKITISQHFSELGKRWRRNLNLYSKHPIFIFFMNCGKWESQIWQHSKNPKSLCEFGKTWKYNINQHSKNSHFESMDKLGNQRFSEVFRGCRNEKLGQSGSNSMKLVSLRNNSLVSNIVIL